MPESDPLSLIQDFKAFYRDIGPVDARQFERLYDDGVRFRDPVHELRGSASLLAYMEAMAANVEFGRFEYLDEVILPEAAYIKWNMNFRHPRLGEQVHSVRGVTHVLFQQRIVYHEDVYDLGEMLYEHLPLVGAATRWIKRRLAG